jgi:molecular chaperone DnaK
MKNINYGIDLGTTNSLIAKYDNGQVKVYKNPVGFRETLPSVVMYRGDRIVVGDKARENFKSNSTDIFALFKRKMGTEEVFQISQSSQSISPIELSSIILKELKNFVIDDSTIDSVVITIPASFDTIQSNATKIAGQQAGFREVVLLQEPIAASLAYANVQKLDLNSDMKWLVYDFGGGTFDVALVHINHRELKIIDHKGNNFLGGLDLDNLIIEKYICPIIEKKLGLTQVWTNMLSGDTKYKKLYYDVLYRTEEAKKELSVADTAYIELQSDEFNLYEEIKLDAEIFNAIIDKKIDETIDLIKELLKDNHLLYQDIERIILVGGTTLIPYLREKLENEFQLKIDNSIDPSTAIAIGAAFFAGNKLSGIEVEKTTSLDSEKTKLNDVKIIYEKTTNDAEELIYFESSHIDTLQFRLIRSDGGFDSGIKKFTKSFSEFVSIKEKLINTFTLQILDLENNVIYTTTDIQIVNGLYNVSGQPLPNDICIELDSKKGDTFLDVIFKKNMILPVSKTIYKTISKNILKSQQDKLIINIVEGKSGSLPGSNLSIGFIELKSEDLKDDLIKGTDIEITLSISESRDINVEIYINSIDQEINHVFSPHTRHVSIDKMKNELNLLITKIDIEIENELEDENLDILQKLKSIRDTGYDLLIEIETIATDVTTDIKYKIDESKRQLMVKFDDMTRNRNLNYAVTEYGNIKANIEREIIEFDEKYQQEFKRIVQNDKEIINSGNIEYLERKIKELDKFFNTLYFSIKENYANEYYFYRTLDLDNYRDSNQASKIFELGDKAMENERYSDFKAIVNSLFGLLTDTARKLHFKNDSPLYDNSNSTGIN